MSRKTAIVALIVITLGTTGVLVGNNVHGEATKVESFNNPTSTSNPIKLSQPQIQGIHVETPVNIPDDLTAWNGSADYLQPSQIKLQGN